MRYLLIILMVLLANFANAQLENKYIRKGVEEYNSKQYGNSEVSYQKALEQNPNSYEAQYNLADAFYKQAKYDEATKEFNSLIDKTTDKVKLSKLYYNLGNSNLKKTEKILEEQKLEEAIKQIDKSIVSYKNSLKNNPTNKNAKYNLAYAKKLKELLEQKNQQNKQNKKNNQNQDNKQNQDQNQKDQNQQDQQNQNQPSKGDSDGDGIPDDVEKGNNPDKPRDTDKDGTPDHQDNDSDNDGKSDSEEAGQNPEKPQDTDKDGTPDYRDLDSNNDGKPDSEDNKPKQGKISKEDALRLLQAIENDEKNVQDKLKRVKGKRVRTEKDW